jgi:hypothetical protein
MSWMPSWQLCLLQLQQQLLLWSLPLLLLLQRLQS